MLTWSTVLTYVKGRLSFPSGLFEKSDEDIIEWLKITSLTEFSNYFPDWERCAVLVDSVQYKYPKRGHCYYFFDEEDLPIYGIKQCYFPMDSAVFTGHPYMAPMSFEEMKFWSLEVFKSRFFYPASMMSYTYKFIQPNIVEVSNDYQPGNFVVEYERLQPYDLRKIQQSHVMAFMDLCLSSVMLWIGGMRTMYQNLNTPFADIQINGEALKSDGQALHDKVMDDLIENSRPPIIIDVY